MTVLVTLFTPPTFQATALISLPSGVSADQVATHLQIDALGIVPPESRPLSDFRFLVQPVGNDSPAVAALIVEADHVDGLAEVADDWAAIAVEKLGNQAAVMTHAETPTHAVRPKKAQNMLIGTFLGFALGLLIAGFRESSKQRGAPLPVSETSSITEEGTE